MSAKVEASLADTRPSVPHDEAMARISAVIDAAEKNSQPRKAHGTHHLERSCTRRDR